MAETVEEMGRSPEGRLVGFIVALISEAIANPGSESRTFREAVLLVREYGDKRVRGVQ